MTEWHRQDVMTRWHDRYVVKRNIGGREGGGGAETKRNKTSKLSSEKIENARNLREDLVFLEQN